MRLRPTVTLVLLLTFPASTLAQTVPAAPEANRPAAVEPHPRLDLKALTSPLDVPLDPPRGKPIVIRMPTARPHDFERAAARQSCADSEARGRTDADAKPMSKGWFFGSLGASVAFGIFGFGGTTLASATIKPKPKTVPAGVDALCYAQGFANQARHENKLTALWGGLTGLAAWFIIFGIIASND